MQSTTRRLQNHLADEQIARQAMQRFLAAIQSIYASLETLLTQPTPQVTKAGYQKFIDQLYSIACHELPTYRQQTEQALAIQWSSLTPTQQTALITLLNPPTDRIGSFQSYFADAMTQVYVQRFLRLIYRYLFLLSDHQSIRDAIEKKTGPWEWQHFLVLMHGLEVTTSQREQQDYVAFEISMPADFTKQDQALLQTTINEYRLLNTLIEQAVPELLIEVTDLLRWMHSKHNGSTPSLQKTFQLAQYLITVCCPVTMIANPSLHHTPNHEADGVEQLRNLYTIWSLSKYYALLLSTAYWSSATLASTFDEKVLRLRQQIEYSANPLDPALLAMGFSCLQQIQACLPGLLKRRAANEAPFLKDYHTGTRNSLIADPAQWWEFVSELSVPWSSLLLTDPALTDLTSGAAATRADDTHGLSSAGGSSDAAATNAASTPLHPKSAILPTAGPHAVLEQLCTLFVLENSHPGRYNDPAVLLLIARLTPLLDREKLSHDVVFSLEMATNPIGRLYCMHTQPAVNHQQATPMDSAQSYITQGIQGLMQAKSTLIKSLMQPMRKHFQLPGKPYPNSLQDCLLELRPHCQDNVLTHVRIAIADTLVHAMAQSPDPAALSVLHRTAIAHMESSSAAQPSAVIGELTATGLFKPISNDSSATAAAPPEKSGKKKGKTPASTRAAASSAASPP